MFKTDWRWSPVASYSMFILSSEPKGQDTGYSIWIENLKRKWQRTDLFVLHQPLRRARITSLFVTETQKAAIFVGRFRVCFLSNRIIGENFFCWVLLLCYFTCWNKGQKWQTGPETTSDIPKKLQLHVC